MILVYLSLIFSFFCPLLFATPIWESEGKELYYRGLAAEGSTCLIRQFLEELKKNNLDDPIIEKIEEQLKNLESSLGM